MKPHRSNPRRRSDAPRQDGRDSSLNSTIGSTFERRWREDPNRHDSDDERHPGDADCRTVAETFAEAIQATREVR